MNTKRSMIISLILALVLVFSLGSFMLLSAQRSDTPAAPPAASDVVPEAPAMNIQGAILEQETFNQAVTWDRIDDTLIKEYQAMWTVEQGQLRLQSPVAGPNLDPAIYLMPKTISGDAAISAQFYPQGNQAIGLIFGHTDAGYYSFRIFADSSDLHYRATLDRIDTNGLTRLAERTSATDSGYLYNVWQTLTVERSGSTITAFFGNDMIFQLEDTVLDDGQVGIYAANMGDVAVDNFTIAR